MRREIVRKRATVRLLPCAAAAEGEGHRSARRLASVILTRVTSTERLRPTRSVFSKRPKPRSAPAKIGMRAGNEWETLNDGIHAAMAFVVAVLANGSESW
jgi:hypothetical protein